MAATTAAWTSSPHRLHHPSSCPGRPKPQTLQAQQSRRSRQLSPDHRLRVRASSSEEEKAEGSSWRCRRREVGLILAAGIASVHAASPRRAGAEEEEQEAEAAGPAPSPGPDTTITDRVFLDVSICPSANRPDRTLGDASQICSDGEPLGRIVIGLYGRQVPQTVANFKAMVTGAAGSSYEGSIFHRILNGQYIQAGRQGSRDRGEVPRPRGLDRNPETISASSFKLRHARPGTVSLCLAENDDEEKLKLSSDYRNVEFLITTGPGPAPQLDNGNIVFGTVLEGLDVIASISLVPTYKPSERIRQFNDIAEFLGDDRAANARNIWNRPLKSVVISKCGLLEVAKPSLPPGLP